MEHPTRDGMGVALDDRGAEPERVDHEGEGLQALQRAPLRLIEGGAAWCPAA